MRLLIVDDHSVVRQGLRSLLSASDLDASIYEATCGSEALAAFRERRPDLVVLDLNLPNSSGLEVLRWLLNEDNCARILIFSMHSEPLYVARALKAGARGYISKGADVSELLTAIRCVAEGGRYVEREIAGQVVLAQYSSEDPLQRLTTREIDIMRLLAQGKSLSEISQILGVAYKTIANSCGVIKTKLGVERTADLIRLTLEMRNSNSVSTV